MFIDDDDDIKETEETSLSDNTKDAETEEKITADVPNESFKELGESPASEKDDSEERKTVTVQPVQFASFEDLDQVQGPQNQNLNILLDVKLQLSVELGKTDLPIKKVLELTKGSIVTLNKAAGEPVELYANGKLIAHGEVVVIEDNFGLRVTSMTEPENRLNGLQ